MNLTSLICGAEAVKDREYFDEGIRKIIHTREWSMSELKKLGFHCLDSRANFIFATHPSYDAKELFEYLKTQNIYVRYWDSERIRQYLRITVGTDLEMKKFFEVLKKYVDEGDHS